jgi:hypothetical protein
VIGPATRCLLVEGIPGTGKTTTARALAARLAARGLAARWHLEEDPAHPVTPRPLVKRWREPGFGALCTERFARFAAAIPPGGLEILEGTAFQSTARFLWAAERDDELPAYLDGLARALAPAAPTLVHLRPPDRAAHLREVVLPRRGPAWEAKLVAWVEATPRARREGWSGREGFAAFWAAYGAACDAWCEALPLPCVELVPTPGRWPDVAGAVREWPSPAEETP